jgi:hypothetical protein
VDTIYGYWVGNSGMSLPPRILEKKEKSRTLNKNKALLCINISIIFKTLFFYTEYKNAVKISLTDTVNIFLKGILTKVLADPSLLKNFWWILCCTLSAILLILYTF